MTERALQTAIRECNTHGIRYTERQLFYAYAGQRQQTSQVWRRGLVGLVPIVAAQMLRRPAWGILGAMVVVGANRLQGAPRLRISPDEFERQRAAYVRHHGPPSGLLDDLTPPQPHHGPPSEPDLRDYAIPAALICQDADIAAMLLANDMHVRFACAVVTDPIPPEVLAMLARADEPRLYALHDASLEGLEWAYQLPAKYDVPLVAVGLRPAHAQRLQLLCQTSVASPADAPTWHTYYLSSAERTWLEAGYRAELAAVPPGDLLAQLERVLTRGAVSLLPREGRLAKITRLLLGKLG
ncbi:MAG: hypothetical protein ACLFTK_10020 [Anaerolineales bacterium]